METQRKTSSIIAMIFFALLFTASAFAQSSDASDFEETKRLAESGDVEAQSTLPRGFTTENIMKVRAGMTSGEIVQLFGNPKSISSTTCGAGAGKPWQCIIWRYGDRSHQSGNFYFSTDNDVMLLNNFDIDRESSY